MTSPLRYRAPRDRSRLNNFKMFQLSLIESKILLNSEIPEKNGERLQKLQSQWLPHFATDGHDYVFSSLL